MYKLVKIQEVFNTFLELKKDLQIFLDNGFSNFWLYDYSIQFIYNRLNNRKRKHIQSWTVNILKTYTHTHTHTHIHTHTAQTSIKVVFSYFSSLWKMSSWKRSVLVVSEILRLLTY